MHHAPLGNQLYSCKQHRKPLRGKMALLWEKSFGIDFCVSILISRSLSFSTFSACSIALTAAVLSRLMVSASNFFSSKSRWSHSISALSKKLFRPIFFSCLKLWSEIYPFYKQVDYQVRKQGLYMTQQQRNFLVTLL